MVRGEVDGPTGLDHGVAQLGVAGAVRDVPLPGRDDLERAVALFEELHLVHDRLRLADELPTLAQQFDDLRFGAENGLARQLGIGRLRRIRRQDGGGIGDDAAVGSDDGTVRQVELTPPHHVGHVAEGADHGDARPLVFLGEVVRHDGNLDTEYRRRHGRAEEGLVALVVGMRHHGHAGGQQLGPGGLDHEVAAVGLVEGDRVVRRGLLFVFQLGLRHGRAERDVPQGGRLGLVGLAPGQVAQEGTLCCGLRLVADGAVALLPVDGEAQLAPDILELFLVFGCEALAQLDEVAPRDGDLVCRPG